jgi:hypothetical protein
MANQNQEHEEERERKQKNKHITGKTEPRLLSGTALGYGLDDSGFESRQGLENFLLTPFQDRLWVPPSLLFNG